jgi:glutamine amidotransferase
MTKSPLPIGILRLAAGNAGSVERALKRLQIPCIDVHTSDDLKNVSGLIFPGAGAAGAAMEDLQRRKFTESLRNFRKPFLGICLGMQLLFDYSEEGPTVCLEIIPGKVLALTDTIVKPHMGWNRLSTGAYVYFVHSYVCVPDDPGITTMTTNYGGSRCAGVRYKNFFGVQWHPEKSGAAGGSLLLSFASLCK